MSKIQNTTNFVKCEYIVEHKKVNCFILKTVSIVASTVVPKDYWDKKNLQDMGPLSVNSIHIRGLLFEKNKIF